MKKKNRCLTMLFSLCITLSIPQLYYASSTKRKSTPGTAIFVMAQVQDSLVVDDITFNYQKNGLKLEIHVPQISKLSDSKFQKQLNKTLLNEATTRKNDIINLAKSYNKDMIKDGLTPIPFEYIETFLVIPSVYPNYTIEQYKYQYSGGAHGISEFNYLNINQETNQIITLADLFKEQVDYTSIINSQVKQEITRRTTLGEFFFMGSDSFQSIHQKQPFFINKEGDIVIVFNVYEIAPYASGPIYIVLTKESLQPYLK